MWKRQHFARKHIPVQVVPPSGPKAPTITPDLFLEKDPIDAILMEWKRVGAIDAFRREDRGRASGSQMKRVGKQAFDRPCGRFAPQEPREAFPCAGERNMDLRREAIDPLDRGAQMGEIPTTSGFEDRPQLEGRGWENGLERPIRLPVHAKDRLDPIARKPRSKQVPRPVPTSSRI